MIRRPRLPGLQLPGLHLPSIRGRAWTDRGPLLLAAVVVALATLLASAVPQLIRDTADEAVSDAVARAGDGAALIVTAPFEFEQSLTGGRTRPGRSAEIVDDTAIRAKNLLNPDLAAALRPPVSTVVSTPLEVSGHGPGRVFQLTYVAGAEKRVTWTAGAAPRSTVPEAELYTAARTGPEPWPVQVGLSEATAAELDLTAGDLIQAQDRQFKPVEIQISGIFRALDPAEPSWQAEPELLRPLVGADGTGTRIDLQGLMSAQSLPDGQLALDPDDVTCTIRFTPEPVELTWGNAKALATAVVALKATSGGLAPGDTALRWESGLDRVLDEARAQVAAATAQASVLLVGLITTAALVLLLAADLLVRRRATVLAGVRMRGASLAGVSAELVLESVAMTLAGGAVGVLLGRALAGGYSWSWVFPVVLVAVLGGPVLGTRVAARATSGRRVPANRSARRSATRTAQLRRVALEAALVLAAAGAFAALRQRGVVPADPDDNGGNLLQAVAPTLAAASGALLLLRLLPPIARLALHRAGRSTGSLPLLAAARAAVSAARPLPIAVLVMSSALLTFALAAAGTQRSGQEDGAWLAVGADARLDLPADPAVTALARRVAAAPGVAHAVPARVTENVMVATDTTVRYVRLVIVEPAAFRDLLADTPLPGGSRLDLLDLPGQPGGRAPALLRSVEGDVRPGTNLTLQGDDDLQIPLAAVGPGPAVGAGPGDVLVVAATTFAAVGADADPNTVWVTGPRAAEALVATAGPGAPVTVRADVLAERRSAPLAAGLLQLATASIGILLLWGLLSVVLGAAASAPARGETLARLRTLGLRARESRRVAAGELLPPVAVCAVAGVGLGVLIAHACLGLLGLRSLTGQTTDPALVVPWLSVVPVLVLMLAVIVVVGVESSLRRRERLGQVLRAGAL